MQMTKIEDQTVATEVEIRIEDVLVVEEEEEATTIIEATEEVAPVVAPVVTTEEEEDKEDTSRLMMLRLAVGSTATREASRIMMIMSLMAIRIMRLFHRWEVVEASHMVNSTDDAPY